MRNNIWNLVLAIIYITIISFSFFFGYNLDHWTSFIFLIFAGSFLGWLAAEATYDK